ncbi:MAG: Bug family tripartite tricarboxylate transporter substrate binding protein [Rhodoplanes sp.]
MRRIGWLVAFWLGAGFVATTPAQAQTYPAKPIRAIVPFPAGSATDGMARLVSVHFTKVFGHGIVIENMVGATGTIASRATAKAAPDGYTILFSTNSTHSANAYLYNNLGYDPIADFTPLALLSRAPHAMIVRAEAPYPAFKDFIAAAKTSPDKLNFGYGNTGSLAGGAMLNAAAGIKTTAVSYRGTPQVTTDLLGGQIDFVVMDVSTTQEHVKAGKLRTLGVTGLTRMDIFPDAPTMIELGYPDFVLYSWNGVHGPAGVPPEIVATLNKAIRDAIKTPEGKRFYAALGAEIGNMPAPEFAAFVAQELKRWERIIALTGLPKQ